MTAASLSVHLRHVIPETQLLADLPALLGVPPGQLSPLFGSTEKTIIHYQIIPRRRGFRTTLDLHVAREAGASVPRSDLELARIVTRHYQQDAVICPPDDAGNPFRWVLVRPSGERVDVWEIPSRAGDVLEIVEPDVT